MKVLFALVCFLSLGSAFAQHSTALKEGDLHLSGAKAEIKKIEVLCPALEGGMSCMAIGSILTIKVRLVGCADHMGGYFSKFEKVDGKGILYFSAINVFNKASTYTRCAQAPTATVKITVPFEGEIALVELPFEGGSQSSEALDI